MGGMGKPYREQVKRHKVAHIASQSTVSDLLDADCALSQVAISNNAATENSLPYQATC